MSSRVLVALETCRLPKYAAQRELVENTWAKRMPKGFDFEAFDGPRLGVPDDYAGLQKKSKAIIQYAAALDYDGMFKVDDDVYLRTDRLRAIEQPYAGHILPWGANVHDVKETYCAGGFYWLNRQAIRILARAPFDVPFMDRTSAEDQWVGWTLRQHGIVPYRLPEIAMQPCCCGQCELEPQPEEWMAYMLWQVYRREEFLGLEARYGKDSRSV